MIFPAETELFKMYLPLARCSRISSALLFLRSIGPSMAEINVAHVTGEYIEVFHSVII